MLFNFEHFNFLKNFKTYKTIKDLWHLVQITSVQEQPPGSILKKSVFRKYAENLQENTHDEVCFQQLKSHFGIVVLL